MQKQIKHEHTYPKKKETLVGVREKMDGVVEG